MLEVLKFILNYKEAGIALFFAVLFYFDFRKKIISLDKTISDDLVYAINELTNEVREMNKS